MDPPREVNFSKKTQFLAALICIFTMDEPRLGLFHLKSYWRGCLRTLKKSPRDGLRIIVISLRGGPQKSLISLQGGINIGPPEYCGVVNFFHLPHFIGFIVVNCQTEIVKSPSINAFKNRLDAHWRRYQFVTDMRNIPTRTNSNSNLIS